MRGANPEALLCEDYSYLEKKFTRKSSLRCCLIFGTCLMFILIMSMFIIVMLAMVRVRILENEVENMKETLTNLSLLDNDLINTIIGFEYDDIGSNDNSEDLSGDEDNIPMYESRNPDIYPNIYIDYDNYEPTNEIANLTEENDYQSPMNLTKEGKESVRSKRDIVAATQDGVVINSESYAEKKKARNDTLHYTLRGRSVTAFPARPSSIGSRWPVYTQSYHTTSPHRQANHKHSTKAPPSVYNRQSRVMHHPDKPKSFRQTVKKSALKSGDSYMDSNEDITTTSPDFIIVRDDGFSRQRYRQKSLNLENLDERHYRTGRIKPLPAVHYNGDTSKYVVGQHTNYMGNGHIRHHQRTFVDWKSSNWVDTLGMDSHFTIDNGYVTIKEAGLYLVYSQIYYLDEHDTAGYRVYKNDVMVLQCTLTIHSVSRAQKGNTCYTAGVEYFAEGDRVFLSDITEGRLSLFEPGKSFFGLVKLGDVKIK